MYDLQGKESLYKNKEENGKEQNQHRGSPQSYSFDDFFYFLNQKESLSFISSSVSFLLSIKRSLYRITVINTV